MQQFRFYRYKIWQSKFVTHDINSLFSYKISFFAKKFRQTYWNLNEINRHSRTIIVAIYNNERKYIGKTSYIYISRKTIIHCALQASFSGTRHDKDICSARPATRHYALKNSHSHRLYMYTVAHRDREKAEIQRSAEFTPLLHIHALISATVVVRRACACDVYKLAYIRARLSTRNRYNRAHVAFESVSFARRGVVTTGLAVQWTLFEFDAQLPLPHCCDF